MFRFALIGAGRMGRAHYAALASSTTARVAAIVDPAGAPGLDLPVYADVPALLAAGGFDGALVAAPTRFHAATVASLAAAGVPTLCEKPCGLVAGDAEAIASAVEAARIPFRVGYWRRHVPELRALHARIAAGEMGEIQLVLCLHWDVEPPPPAFRDPASSGGILVDVAVHELDLMRWLTGHEIVAADVYAGGVTSVPPVPGDPENASMTVRLSSGGLGLVTVGRRHPPGDHQRVEVIGTRDAVAIPFGVGAEGAARIDAALRAQAEDFARHVAGARSHGATITDAIAALRAASGFRSGA